jgi:hypothetical protein
VSLRASTGGCDRLAFDRYCALARRWRLRGPGRRLGVCPFAGTRLGLDLAAGAQPLDVVRERLVLAPTRGSCDRTISSAAIAPHTSSVRWLAAKIPSVPWPLPKAIRAAAPGFTVPGRKRGSRGPAPTTLHHHCAIVTAAHGFLTLERADPNGQRPA